jgi:hypothetical protein
MALLILRSREQAIDVRSFDNDSTAKSNRFYTTVTHGCQDRAFADTQEHANIPHVEEVFGLYEGYRAGYKIDRFQIALLDAFLAFPIFVGSGCASVPAIFSNGRSGDEFRPAKTTNSRNPDV